MLADALGGATRDRLCLREPPGNFLTGPIGGMKIKQIIELLGKRIKHSENVTQIVSLAFFPHTNLSAS
jgi:hypothetical protein